MASSTPQQPGTKKPHIAIIGGGLGGLPLAISLQNHRASFTIYEAAKGFSDIGFGVSLARNAEAALAQIDPRLSAAFDRQLMRNVGATDKYAFRLGEDGRPGTGTAGFKAGDLFATTKGQGGALVHRAKWVAEMAALIEEGRAVFGKKAVGFEQGEDGVKVRFADGSEIVADIVVGCDGVKSAIRRGLLGEASDPRFSGTYVYRGLIPMAPAEAIMGREKTHSSQAYLGYGGHIFTLALEEAAMLNIIAFRTHLGKGWEGKEWVVRANKEEMLQDFAGWSPDVQKLLGLMDDVDQWALFEHSRIKSFFKGRVCLLGDAAHAMTPFQGSGAGSAIEDAYVLGLLLGAVQDMADVPAAFSAYDEVRLERTLRIVESSRGTGAMFEFLDPVFGDDLKAIAKDHETRSDWIFDADVPEMGRRAMEVFEQQRKLGKS